MVPAAALTGAVAIVAVSAGVSASPAKASTPGPVLVLLQNGETTAPEYTLLRNAGYSVSQATPTQWQAMTLSQFQGYAALVIGDPSSGSCSTLTPTLSGSGSDVLGTTWQGAVTGNISILGTAPALPGTSAANSLITGAAEYAAAGYNSQNQTGTGLYVSLNCDYSADPAGTQVAFLNGVENIGTTAGKPGPLTVQGSLSCSDAGTANKWEAESSGTLSSLTSSMLSGTTSWPSPSCPVEEAFDSWPANITPVGYDTASDAAQTFTGSSGQSGQPYLLLGTPPLTTGTQAGRTALALAPSTGGQVPAMSTVGGTNPGARGVHQQVAADAVNTENGDLTRATTDLSVSTFGPLLDFDRVYDSQAAQAQTETLTPGVMGYGWTDNWNTSIASGRPVPGDIYTIDGLATDNGNGGPPTQAPLSAPGAVVTSGGNTYVADSMENRVLEVAGTTHTQWGISMTAGDEYVIAGSPTGVSGDSPGGTPASSSLLDDPQGVAVDGSGNLYIADTANNRVVELVATSGQNRGFGSMTVNDIYNIAGHSAQSPGHSGDGGLAQSAFLNQPYGVSTGHGNSDIYIADTFNNRVQEIPAETGTQWGQSMTAWDMYTVTGSVTGNSGTSGDGGPAGSALLNGPQAITFSAAGDMYIADTTNNRIQEIPVANGGQWGITPAFTADDIYTVAGNASGNSGHSANGTVAVNALLNQPYDVVANNGTQLYIADQGDDRVEEVARSSHAEWGISMTANDLYTIAGTGATGFSGDGGLATSAKLFAPEAAWLDSSGNLDIADTGNNRVRQVSVSTGDISEYAGDGGTLANDGDNGSALAAAVSGPGAVTTDSSGNVYIADADNNRVQEIAASSHSQFGIAMTAGDVYTVAGSANGIGGTSGDGGKATSALLYLPGAVAVDAQGNLFIADSGNDRIQKVSASTGNVSTVAGSSSGLEGSSGDGGSATSALLTGPQGVAVDPGGDLYIADYGNTRVQEVPAATGPQWGQQMTAGDMYTVAGDPAGVNFGHTGDNGPVRNALFNSPNAVSIDSSGDVYISDWGNNRIQDMYNGGPSWGQHMTIGDMYTVAGNASGNSGSSGDGGPAVSALLSNPDGVTVDTTGNLYISDGANNRVQEVPVGNGVQWGQQMTAGDMYTVVGSAAGTSGSGGLGGPATGALLNLPGAIGIDSSGNLYLADGGNNAIDEVVSSARTLFAQSPSPDGVTITQPGGSQVTFYPVGSGCVAPYVLVPSGQYCALPQDVAVNLTYSSGSGTYTYAEGPGESLTYNSAGQLTAVSDVGGDTVTISYGAVLPGQQNCPSSASWCQTITGANGRVLTIGYNSANLITTATDPMGRQWGYSYTGSDLTSATDPMGNVSSYTYGAGSTGNPDNANNLLTITEPNGQSGGPDAGTKTANVYNAGGQAISQTDPMGNATTFNYCLNSAAGDCMNSSTGTGMVTETYSDGSQAVFGYIQGALASVTTPDGSTRPEEDFGPDTSGGTLLVGWNGDADGGVTTFSYSSGQMTSVTAPMGDQSTMQATSLGTDSCFASAMAASPCSASQPGPALVAPGGAITPATAPPAGTEYDLYTTSGQQLYTAVGIYPPGSSTATGVSADYTLYKGNSVTLNGNNISCTQQPVSAALPCATIDANGNVTQYAYNAQGELTSSSAPDGNGTEVAESTYSYDGDGEQLSVTSPDGNLPQANAGNYTAVTAYNADGEVTSDTLAGGAGATVTPRTTSYSYDPNGNRTKITSPRGFGTTTTFNADDEPTLVTNADNNSSLVCYNGMGDATQTVPPAGVAANNLTPASCPTAYPSGYGQRLASDATTATFDAEGLETSATTPAPAGQSGFETTSYTHDPEGNLIEVSSPPASNASGAPDQVTYDTYNADQELTSETTGYGTSAAATVSYCYDPNGDATASVAADGNVNGVAPCNTNPADPYSVDPKAYPTQAANQTTASYDSTGQLASITSPATTAAPNGMTTSFTYDLNGQMLTSTDPKGITTTQAYAPTGQVASVSYSGSSAHAVTYAYDANDQLTGMTDASGSASYTYSPFGEVMSATNGAGNTVGYTYNADGKTASVTYPLPSSASWATSQSVTYGYDHADALTSATDFNGNQIAISYTADGMPSSETLGATGDTLATTYDQADAPSAITLKKGTSTLLGFSYSDAPSGDVLSETDTPGSSPTSYTYDALGQIASMTPGGGGTKNYSFDPSGNLTTLPTGASAATNGYDNAGELTSSVLGGVTTSYTYDADGQRLTSSQGSTQLTSGTWNGAGNLTAYSDAAAGMTAATYDGDGLRTSATTSGTTQNFTWSGNSLLMDSSNAYIYTGGNAPSEQVNLSTGTINYLAADSLGSVRGVVKNDGTVAASTSYDAWGNPQSPGGVSAYTPFGYSGGYTDPTGLIYLINRYYDPSTGQFLSIDPAVGATGQPYQYAGGDPVSVADPAGLWEILIGSGFPPPRTEHPFTNWVADILGKTHKPPLAETSYRVEFLPPYADEDPRFIDVYSTQFGWMNETKIGVQREGTNLNSSEADRDRLLLSHNSALPGVAAIACHRKRKGDPCRDFATNGDTWWFGPRAGEHCQNNSNVICPTWDLRKNLLKGSPAINNVYVVYDGGLPHLPHLYLENRKKIREALENNDCPNDAMDDIGLPNEKFSPDTHPNECVIKRNFTLPPF